MAEILRWDEFDAEAPYALQQPDPLGVLSSTREVVADGEHVWIDQTRLVTLAEQWTQLVGEYALTNVPLWYDQYHFSDDTERTVNWILVLDALNFCFWAEKDQPRWSIHYKGEVLNGYWAEAAVLTRAVEEGTPLWDANYLAAISSEEVAHIFRGEQTIPLFEQRLANAQEVGRVLLEHFDGQFARAVEQAAGSAVKLALLLAEHFPSFHDAAAYRHQQVYFLKRAQICVADLRGAFAAKRWGAFHDIDQLTIFADYKLPQVLRHFGVLIYDPKLAALVDNQELLVAGSEQEIEIRAATIWACELLRRELSHYGHPITAVDLDQQLWLLGQQLSNLKPYHRTRTIYY